MWYTLQKIAMENRQLQQLVIILKRKDDTALLTYVISYKEQLTCRKLLRYFRRYTMNEVVSEGYIP